MTWSINFRATRLSSLMREWIIFQRIALLGMLPLENESKERGRREDVDRGRVCWESVLVVMAQSILWYSLGYGAV